MWHSSVTSGMAAGAKSCTLTWFSASPNMSATGEIVATTGQSLGRYRIIEQIGAGGMGVVYRARDERLERDVALKLLPAGTLADKVARKRFRQEALALSQLNHPNIATIYDFDSQSGVDFLAMEYIQGTTLDCKLTAGALAEKEVLSFGGQLASGLVAAHERGVVHRDLKPGNLRLTPDGQLKILDFGSAKLRSEEHTSELQSRLHLVCRLLLEKKKKKEINRQTYIMHCDITRYIYAL